MAPRERLFKPVISGGDFAYKRVNVAAQQGDPKSLMNWMERLIARQQCPEFGPGRLTPLEAREPGLLLYRREWQGVPVLAIHNLADRSSPRASTPRPRRQST